MPMRSIQSLLLVALLFISATAAAANSKEDAAAKAEADLIAREDEQARHLDGDSPSPLIHFDVKGKLALYAEDDPDRKNNVVGIFSTEKGTFQVKANDTILKLIAPYDKKEVTLIGKLRGEGKYFIVSGVGGGGAPPVAKTNKKRI